MASVTRNNSPLFNLDFKFVFLNMCFSTGKSNGLIHNNVRYINSKIVIRINTGNLIAKMLHDTLRKGCSPTVMTGTEWGDNADDLGERGTNAHNGATLRRQSTKRKKRQTEGLKRHWCYLVTILDLTYRMLLWINPLHHLVEKHIFRNTYLKSRLNRGQLLHA